MGESRADAEHAFTHTLTVFSVSAGMIGVCLTAIGLVKIVSQAKGVETVCDDLIVIDAIVFGLAALLGFQGLRRFIRRETPISHQRIEPNDLTRLEVCCQRRVQMDEVGRARGVFSAVSNSLRVPRLPHSERTGCPVAACLAISSFASRATPTVASKSAACEGNPG